MPLKNKTETTINPLSRYSKKVVAIMKRFFTYLLLAFTILQMHAQKHELGLFLGATNGITDIGRTDYINPFPKDDGNGKYIVPLNLGLLYKFNLNPHQSLRLNLNYTNFIGNDKLAAEDYRFYRNADGGVKYKQTIYEASVFFEYNFFPINSEQERAHSPYIFAGLGAFGYHHPTYSVVNTINSNVSRGFEPIITKDEDLKFAYNIPFGIGYKYKFNYNWTVSLEIGVRATSVDDIDMAEAKEEDFTFLNEDGLTTIVDQSILDESNQSLIAQRRIGDFTNNDWYVVSGLMLTYSFGRLPCFCD